MTLSAIDYMRLNASVKMAGNGFLNRRSGLETSLPRRAPAGKRSKNHSGLGRLTFFVVMWSGVRIAKLSTNGAL